MRRDEGSVTLLTVGLAGLLLAVLVGLAQTGRIFLAQRSLAGVCDAAATAAAQGLDDDALYGSGRIRLAAARARADLARWLARPGVATDAPGMHASVTTVDAAEVGVRCTRHVTVGFTRVVGLGDRDLVARATARLR